MPRIASPWKSFGLGVLFVVFLQVAQVVISGLVPDESSWPRYCLPLLLMLSPIAFIPFVDRLSAMFFASLGTALTLFFGVLLYSFFFLSEYESTDWSGVTIMICVLLGVSLFLACPIVHLSCRRRTASESGSRGA